jgi:hypothetical protein
MILDRVEIIKKYFKIFLMWQMKKVREIFFAFFFYFLILLYRFHWDMSPGSI